MTRFQRRTRLFIAKSFQIRYISLIMAFMFISAILAGYTVYVTTWIMFGEKLAAVYPQGLLFDIVNKVNLVLLLRLIFLSPMVILIGLVLSNRIAGPIYRIRRFLDKVYDGHYECTLKLREKDELQDLAESLNQLVARMRAEKGVRKDKITLLHRAVDDLEAALISFSGDRERLIGMVLKVREIIEDAKQVM